MKSSFEFRTIEEVAAILDTDLHVGLQQKEAQRRLKDQGENRIFDYHLPVFSGIGSLFFDLSSVLLLIGMLICAFLSYPDYALLIGVAWAVNRLSCGMAYLLRVHDHYAAALSRIPHVRVVRDGKKRWVDTRALVPGDLVLLTAGDMICFDGRIVRFSDFTVRAANRICTPDKMIFAGMLVTSGDACAIVTATGDRTQTLAQHGLLPMPSPGSDFFGYARIKRADLSDHSLSFEKICRVQGVVAAAFVLFAAGYALLFGMQGNTLLTVFVSAVCAVASSFSDLLFAGWNFGIFRICRDFSKSKVPGETIRILSEERLSALREADSFFMPLSILAGQNGLQVDTLVTPNGTITALPFSHKPNCETTRLSNALANMSLCFSERKDPVFSAISHDLPNAFRRCSVARKAAVISWSVYADAGTGLSVMRTLHGNRGELSVIGDAETVLRYCAHFQDGEKSVPITADTARGLAAVLRHYRDCGFSVCAIAVCPSSQEKAPVRPASLCQNMELLGFCVCAKRRVAGASDFLKECLEQKIRLRLFSDMPVSEALNICGTLGLDKKSLAVWASPDALAEPDLQWLNYGVYIGCSPMQKQKLLEMAQKNGEKCIYCADRFEEEVCLKSADFAVSAIPHRQKGKGCDALYSVSHAAFLGSPLWLLRAKKSVCGLQKALLGAARALCTAQVARFLWFLVSLCAFQSAPAPGGVLLSGLFLDLLILASFAEKNPKPLDRSTENIHSEQEEKSEWLLELSSSGIWVLMSLAAYTFLRLLAISVSYSAVSLLSLLLFSSGMLLLSNTPKQGGRRRPTVASFLSLFLVCGIAVAGCLISSVAELLCGCPLSWTEFAVSATAALFSVFLSHSLMITFRKRRNENAERRK